MVVAILQRVILRLCALMIHSRETAWEEVGGRHPESANVVRRFEIALKGKSKLISDEI